MQAFTKSPGFPMALADAPPESEGSRFRHRSPCPTFRGTIWCGMEWDEWQLVRALVRPSDAVLEFGARYGTTSCNLARATLNSGRVVAVEPDSRVRDDLLHNRALHNCSFHIVHGTVADRPHVIDPRNMLHYGTRTAPFHRRGRVLPNIGIREIEQRVGWRFNTLLIDCEGCITDVLTGTVAEMLGTQIVMVLIEEDAGLNYSTHHQLLRSKGLSLVWDYHLVQSIKRMREFPVDG
ncbi:hypothetical protein EMIHUDRAFT_210751 [Emiliania huxleyi CCMP1516]|uniref:Methyltransferase FkbM domain-containing protein n=2 Tax=Emiliania huxleyi TaxID=2903 RepID=A0A0D3IYN4_EMIH1|nr:hypothetical protein EMIHUDRAFT_210751 [Emiliania huxleyi CCMP1516]EOD16369.1 hypothetical protein EMIHUDRAFT_210751 [Emiliania huxleyi CCMP1516]|eukprot:XP_005768798.1 hypothetical protein EMIHUDRAFT_210751 [Emiliania huxleyi CCMP1516]